MRATSDPVDAHRCLAIHEDEAADIARRSLLDHDDAGPDVPLLGETCELLQLPLAEPTEEPNAAKLVHDRCHAPIIFLPGASFAIRCSGVARLHPADPFR